MQVVAWPHDSACDRAWLLDNVEGAAGIVVMLSDKVSPFALVEVTVGEVRWLICSLRQVDDELLDKGKPSRKPGFLLER